MQFSALSLLIVIIPLQFSALFLLIVILPFVPVLRVFLSLWQLSVWLLVNYGVVIMLKWRVMSI